MCDLPRMDTSHVHSPSGAVQHIKVPAKERPQALLHYTEGLRVNIRQDAGISYSQVLLLWGASRGSCSLADPKDCLVDKALITNNSFLIVIITHSGAT
jgi:hypothetical protein